MRRLVSALLLHEGSKIGVVKTAGGLNMTFGRTLLKYAFLLTSLFLLGACSPLHQGNNDLASSSACGGGGIGDFWNPSGAGENPICNNPDVVDGPGSEEGTEGSEETEQPPLIVGKVTLDDVVNKLPKAADSFAMACQLSNGLDNLFTRNYCNGQDRPANLDELFNTLDVQNGRLAVTLNTGGLTAEEVTAMTPRFILFPQNAENNPDGAFCITAYAQGKLGFVEAICRNVGTDIDAPNNFSFYLFDYDLNCEANDTCNNGNFFGPTAETDWAQVSVHENTILQNTVLDCSQCHQAGGTAARNNLRMPARANPWFGWCRNNRASGTAVLNILDDVHGNNTYATVNPNNFDNCDPAELEDLVQAVGNGNSVGNNIINSGNVEDDNDNTTGGTFLPDNANDPDNDIFSDDLSDRIIAMIDDLENDDLSNGVNELFPHKGSIIAPVVNNTLDNLTTQYNQFLNGQVDNIDDPLTVNSDNENVLRQAGKMIYPAGLDGQALLRRACAQCHNSALRQDISRALFNVDLDEMGAARNVEIDKAIARIDLESDDARLMPPLFHGHLSADEKQRLKDYLQSQKAP